MISRRSLRRAARACAAAAACVALLGSATAHQASDAYLRASAAADATLALQVEVALRDLDVVLELDADADGRLLWGELRPRQADVVAYVAQRVRVVGGGCTLRPEPGWALDRKADGVYAVLHFASDCPVAEPLRLTYALFQESDPTHRGLLVVLDAQGRPGAAPRSLAPDGVPLDLIPQIGQAAPARGPGGGFFGDGLVHVLSGADHVLFLLCLLLPLLLGGGQRTTARDAAAPLLALVTAFTVGHSITLGLASLRIASVSPALIEPLIALTIALSAADNLRPLRHARRTAVGFGFGMVHGFGLAGPLTELQLAPASMAWALLQFNLGVEGGQLLILATALLVLWPLRRHAAAAALQRGGSVAAGLVALIWLAERMAGFKLLPL